MSLSEAEPTVSVVVAVRNGAPCIEDCIRSLLELEYPRHAREIIVVDNGSTDGTVALVEAHCADVRLLHEGTRGAAAARNAGIREARGRSVAFTDADCTVEPGWLAGLTAPLEDETVGIVGGRILATRDANRIARFGERIHDHRSAIEDCQPPYAISMNWASRTSVLRAVGLFDEELLRGQDVDLAIRISRAGYRIVYVPGAVIHHRNERTLGGLFAEGFVHGRHNLRVRRKHRSSLGGRPLRDFVSLVAELARGSVRMVIGKDRIESCLAVVFGSGKLLGHALGTLEAPLRRRPLQGKQVL